MTSLTIFSTKLDVAAASMAELVSFYNSLSGKPAIKKFETRGKGVERCTVLLKPEGAPAPTGVDPETAAKAEVTKIAKAEHSRRKAERAPSTGMSYSIENGIKVTRAKGKKPKPATSAMGAIARTVVKPDAPAKKSAPKPKLAAKPGRGRALFSEDGVITIKHKGENPKRGTAADRYALYRTGQTVAAYIAAGGQRRDVVWDIAQGWITVKG